jgi:hypothetical protein
MMDNSVSITACGGDKRRRHGSLMRFVVDATAHVDVGTVVIHG